MKALCNNDLAPRLVEYLKTLPEGSKISLSQLVARYYESEGVECDFVDRGSGWRLEDTQSGKALVHDDDLFELLDLVRFFAAREGILLDFSEYDDMTVGLPYNLRFTVRFNVRELSDPEAFHLCVIRMPARESRPTFSEGSEGLTYMGERGAVIDGGRSQVVFNSTVTNSPVSLEADGMAMFVVRAQPIDDDCFVIRVDSPGGSFIEAGIVCDDAGDGLDSDMAGALGSMGGGACGGACGYDPLCYEEPMLDAFTAWYFLASHNPIDPKAFISEYVSEC